MSTGGLANRAFFARPVAEVAKDLLGMVIVHRDVAVRLTEVEAYEGPDDPASHAFRGPTQRNAVMFGPAGHLYVYRSHGLHWCANVTTGPEGRASAVLLRAGEVVRGMAEAQSRRGPAATNRRLAQGPGNLGQALGFTGADNGIDLCDGGDSFVEHGESVDSSTVARGPRVGVTLAADVELRFWLMGEPTVSAYRRSPRAAPMPGRMVK